MVPSLLHRIKGSQPLPRWVSLGTPPQRPFFQGAELSRRCEREEPRGVGIRAAGSGSLANGGQEPIALGLSSDGQVPSFEEGLAASCSGRGTALPAGCPPAASPQVLCILLRFPSFQNEHEIAQPRRCSCAVQPVPCHVCDFRL